MEPRTSPVSDRGAVVPDFAARLNHLFDTIRRDDGKPFSNKYVADAISRPADVDADADDDKTGDVDKISHNYIWMLRNGQRRNPTRRHMEALANFFGVAPDYFAVQDDERYGKINDQLELLGVLRRAGVQKIAMRLGGLSDKGLQTVAEIVEVIRKAEGAPAEEQAAPAETDSTT